MFGSKLIKRAFGFGKRSEDESSKDPENESIGDVFKKAPGKISGAVDNFFSKAVEEFGSIMEKSKDLSSTNYNLGMKYLDEGNIKEAIFRFKITKKFWPDNHEAYYQLIVCFVLQGKTEKAKKVADELLKIAPQYRGKIFQLVTPDNKEGFSNSSNSDPKIK
ncbi:MAG: tetratricopeptide (TPR) repeat protein [Rickettsiales bacterium]|jgi:tetratricopeptide (TPR) repeat protein